VVEREVEEEPDGWEIRREMRREALAVGHGARRGKEVQQPRHQMPACDGGAVRGDRTGRDTIADVERVLQHRLDVARPGRPRMRVRDLAASPNQMRETGLMRRLIELAIRRPPVADEGAVEVGAEHRRRFVKAAPVLNGVDDGARGRKDPQPPEPPPDFPAGLIRTDDRAPAIWSRNTA
jgi:hypothetical protein